MTHLNAAAAPGLLLIQGTREELEMVRSALATVIGGETEEDWERCAGIAPAGLTIGAWEVLPGAPAGHLAEPIAARLSDRSARQQQAAERLEGLPARELRIARLMAAGHSNGRIAIDLNLSEATVRNYLSNLYDALGLSNRVQLARLVWEAGLSE